MKMLMRALQFKAILRSFGLQHIHTLQHERKEYLYVEILPSDYAFAMKMLRATNVNRNMRRGARTELKI